MKYLTYHEAVLELKAQGFKTLCGMEELDGWPIEDINEYLQRARELDITRSTRTCCEQGCKCFVKEGKFGKMVVSVCEKRPNPIMPYYGTHSSTIAMREDFYELDDD